MAKPIPLCLCLGKWSHYLPNHLDQKSVTWNPFLPSFSYLDKTYPFYSMTSVQPTSSPPPHILYLPNYHLSWPLSWAGALVS